METAKMFAQERISRILLKIAPPVMLAQLIQALYNIVDSFFVGRYSDSGLTALSIIYPMQLLMIALAVGTGVGINTVMAAKLGIGKTDSAGRYAGVGTPLAAVLWAAFAAVSFAVMPHFARISTDSPEVAADVVRYGRIVCLFSFGLFFESIWTKILQAEGDMKTPMAAQILGAAVNILLDPLLIFGLFGLPRLGIAGAAIATVAGQTAAALVVMKKGWRKSPALGRYPRYIGNIFRMGVPNMLMQSAYTFYILGLNLILSTFSDKAVTALGLYYKWQTFFFIPLGAMQICIVPIISFNYAAKNLERCKTTLRVSVLFGMALMALGTLCFLIFPEQLLRVFSNDEAVIEIGKVGFRFVGVSFIPLVTSLIFPVFFQAVGESLKSSLLTVIRTVVLFVPLGYAFSRLGLNMFWLTFPVTETVTTLAGFRFYRSFLRKPYGNALQSGDNPSAEYQNNKKRFSGGKSVIKKLIGDRAFYKRLIALMLPIMVQNGITNFVNMLDNIMIGAVGTAQMTGVAVANQLFFVFNLCIFGAVSGAGIFGAQYFGKKDYEGVRYTFRFKFIFCGLVTLFSIALFYFGGEALVSLYMRGESSSAADAAMALGYSLDYMRIMLLGLLPYSIVQCYSSTLREGERPMLPMLAGMVAVAVNMSFNYILIFGKFGAPVLGVKGAAIATVLSRFAELAVVIFCLHKNSGEYSFMQGVLNSLYLPKKLAAEIFIKGLPLIINETLWATGIAVVNQCYSVRSLDAVAACNISQTFWNVFSIAYMAVGTAVGIILGQMLGADKLDEAKPAAYKMIAFSFAISSVVALLYSVLAGVIPLAYNTEPQIRHLATQLMRMTAVIMPFEALTHSSYFTLRSGGRMMITFIFDCGFTWGGNVLLAYTLGSFTAVPFLGIFAAVQCVSIIKAVAGLMLVRNGGWVKKIVAQ